MHTEQLTTSSSRIYSPDAIPLWALSSKRVLTHIGRTFGFEQFQFAQPDDTSLPPALTFGRGRAPTAEPSEPATIESLFITHTQLDLVARDPDGHAFNDTILLELSRVCDEVNPETPVWVNQFRVEFFQTVWVGRMDLAPEDLIDPRARGPLLTALRATTGKGTRRVQARGLRLQITTQTPEPALLELGIQIPDEDFKLEPRSGRLAEERVWFSTSALRSEDHLRLLEQIEQAYRS